MSAVSFRPSQVTAPITSSDLYDQAERDVAAAILAYLVANGNRWMDICWTGFLTFLKNVPATAHMRCAHDARSAFSYRLADVMSSMASQGLIGYRQASEQREYITLSPRLMAAYEQAYTNSPAVPTKRELVPA